MEEIEVKIKEVQDYFKQRIINGEFTVVDCGEHCCIIEIDKYSFSFWIGNGKDYFKQYTSSGDPNFIYLSARNSENRRMYRSLKPHIEQYRKDILNKKKMEEYLKLQKELGL